MLVQNSRKIDQKFHKLDSWTKARQVDKFRSERALFLLTIFVIFYDLPTTIRVNSNPFLTDFR